MGLVLVTPPAALAVSLDEAKAHCRVDGTSQDIALTGMIGAATNYVEQYLGRSLMPQTWKVTLDQFASEILLPRGPVTDITAFKYFDANGDEQTVDSALYVLDTANDPPRVVRAPNAAWPVTAEGVNKVQVTYTAAYPVLPIAIKHALLLLISQWYDNRSSLPKVPQTGAEGSVLSELPHAVTALLSNFRSFAF